MNEDRATQLRRDFDAGFAVQPSPPGERREQILIIRLADRRYGLRLSQVEAVVRGKTVTPLPGSPADLLGLAGFRGRLVSVFDLGAWLDHAPTEGDWLALVRSEDGHRLGLAFDGLEQQLSLPPDELLSSSETGWVDSLIAQPEGSLTVLSLPHLIARLGEAR